MHFSLRCCSRNNNALRFNGCGHLRDVKHALHNAYLTLLYFDPQRARQVHEASAKPYFITVPLAILVVIGAYS